MILRRLYTFISRLLWKSGDGLTRDVSVPFADFASKAFEHVDQAILFFDSNGICLTNHSKSCASVLEMAPGGLPIWEVLKTSSDGISTFKQMLNALFKEPIPYEELSELLPKVYEHADLRYVILKYQPIRDRAGKISHVMMIATDKTREREAQVRADHEQAQSDMVVRMMKNKNQFLSFVWDTRQLIAELKQEASKNNPQDVNIGLILRGFHTIKGGAASFCIVAIKNLVHRYEAELVWILPMVKNERPGEDSGFIRQLNHRIDSIDRHFEGFLADMKKLVGISPDSMERSVEVPMSKLIGFGQELSSAAVPKDVRERFMQSFLLEPIQKFFSHFDGIVSLIAGNQSKRVEPITFVGGDIKILSKPYSRLFGSLAHGFRNAVDHGLETPLERTKSGKDINGKIGVIFGRKVEGSQSFLTIEIEDDGRGIEAQVIRQKLKELGREKEAEKLSDHQVLQYVFDSGFTTRDYVSDLSGRGVGLDAVRAAAKKLGGTAEIFSTLGKGTRLVVTVPEILAFNQPTEKIGEGHYAFVDGQWVEKSAA